MYIFWLILPHNYRYVLHLFMLVLCPIYITLYLKQLDQPKLLRGLKIIKNSKPPNCYNLEGPKFMSNCY